MMRGRMFIASLALVASAAQAQVAGGLTGPAGGVGGALNSATGQIRGMDDAARADTREAAKRLDRQDATVTAGARVSRGTRCYAEDNRTRASPYEPTYRNGYHYCERTSPGVAAGAKVRAGG